MLFHIRAVLANPLHHVGRRSLVVEFTFHEVYIGSYMLEEAVISGTQVVKSRFARSRAGKAVFGTFAVAGKQVVALFALGGQTVALVLSKGNLAGAVHHLDERVGVDVAQFVFGEDKVIAAVYIAVKFHYAGVAAGLGHRADTRYYSGPVGEGGVEQLYEVLAHIVARRGCREIRPTARV